MAVSEKVVLAGLAAAGTVATAIVGAVSKSGDKRVAKETVEVPDCIDVNLHEAQNNILEIGLLCIVRPVKARIKFKDKTPNTIVKTSHKAGKKIPPKTTITIDYITQDIIDECNKLYIDSENEKQRKKIERQAKIEKLLPKKKP